MKSRAEYYSGMRQQHFSDDLAGNEVLAVVHDRSGEVNSAAATLDLGCFQV